ncbi:MAG TPA: SH3 domain-containing protein [Nannocystaceae bacterium]|nr:SH3 domain-containing protein [Nannocystaceae bacterium]
MKKLIGTSMLALACGEAGEGRGVEIETGDKFRATASATVAWTGAEGLNVRDAPSTSGERIDWLADGSKVTIVCQTTGDAIDGNTVWDKLLDPDGFVTDAYVKSGYADFIPGVPKCGATDEGCGDVDYQGYCDGETLVWCEDDALHSVDCADAGKSCDFQDASIGWNCLGGGGGGGGSPDFVVAGHELWPQEAAWIEYIGEQVVPDLAGSRHDRLVTAARASWWALKEGVLDLPDALAYSNCNRPWGDVHIGPVDTCDPGRAWQVGLSGSQVPWAYIDPEDTALALFPGQSLADILWATASEAGYDPSTTSTGATIVASTGDLRRSWLLRNSAVGFENQTRAVTSECIDQSEGWCYGTGWDTSARYAPNRATALAAIDELYAIFDALAP